VTASIVDYAVVKRLQGRVAEELTVLRQRREAAGEPTLSDSDERQLALSVIGRVVAEHMRSLVAAGKDLPDGSVDLQLVMAVDAAIYGAGVLSELLDDPDIEDIDINGSDRVWLTYADERGTLPGAPVAASDDDLVQMVQNLASYVGVNARPWTRSHPTLNLRLPGGGRLAATMSACERPAVSIRLNRYPQMNLAQEIDLGTIDEQLAAFLRAAVTVRLNIMVAGATGAGKTSLLRALVNEIPPSERLLVVEKALELGVGHDPAAHPNTVELEEVLPDPDGRGGLSIDDLVDQSRRHNPSRVIVGEVMGPEVVAMLSAMSQGNDGSLSTVHARSAADAINRLCTYAMQHSRLDFPVTSALISGAIDFIVFIRKNPRSAGQRHITEILEIGQYAAGGVTTSRIFTPSPVDGRAARALDVPIIRGDRLADAGYVEPPL